MKDVSITVKALYESFSISEKRLADYVVSNRERIPLKSVYDMAAENDVSTATVSRFVKKLGFSAFKNFKVALAKSSSEGRKSEFYEILEDSDSPEEMIQKVFHGNMKSLEDTLSLLDLQDLIKCARQISTGKRLVFFGIGSSGHICHDSAMRFSLLGLTASGHSDPTEVLFRGAAAEKDDVIIALSHSGKTRITVEGCREASRNGAVVVGIANYLESPLHKVSNYFFCTSFPEQKVRFAALSSRMAQLAIIDSLYLLSSTMKKITIDYKAINDITDQHLRF
jgi:RpiR family transcriptional regulator, carbohydrate utilization regulator